MIKELLETVQTAREMGSAEDLNQIWLPRISTEAKKLLQATDVQVDELLDVMTQLLEGESAPDLSRIHASQLLHPLIHQLVNRQKSKVATGPLSDSMLASTEALYRATPVSSDLRNHLLCLLATSSDEASLRTWAKLLSTDPPLHRLGIVLAFSPVMQPKFQPPPWMMEELLNHAAGHLQIAPAIFDLANFYFRTGKLETHPASSRAEQLTALLGQLVGEMGKIEEGIVPGGEATPLHLKVADCVSLIVALCDGLASIEYEPALGKLHQAAKLKHRRIQTEALAALSRLGDEDGKKALVALAEYPVSRLRVLAFAEELGFLSEISLEYQGEIAMAESKLAIWLAEPTQMGMAPGEIKLVDNREYYWPSYEHPIQCYLFEFKYGSGEQSFSNIAVCGPLIHTFTADLRPLEIEQQYAAFAGWQTLHDEIFVVGIGAAQQSFASDWQRLEHHIQEDESLTDASPVAGGSFFGVLILIAAATRDGEIGTAITDGVNVEWYQAGNPTAPIDWRLAFDIWKGQRLLAHFNAVDNE